MSLYDDVILPEFTLPIPISTSNTSQNTAPKPNVTTNENEIASSWNTNSLKLLQNQVEAARKRQQTLSSASNYVKREIKPSSIAPVVNLADKRKAQLPFKKETENLAKQAQSNGSELRFNLLTGKVEKEDSLINSSLDEEYDPMRPNDYEKVVKELKNHRKKSSSREKESRRKRSSSSSSRSRSRRRRSRSRSSSRSRSRSRSRDRKRRSRRSSSSDDDKRKTETKKTDETPKRNNMFAPPPSLIESDAKPLIENPEEIKPVTKVNTGLFKAEKMMAKMGYKEGEGLGRNNQGMSMALQVEKTGRRSGRIIHEKDVAETITNPDIIQPPVPSPSVITKSPVIHKEPSVSVGIPPEVMKNMSKVILLRNMVTPSEVDPDLEGETKEECQKYGEVNSCVIHVMQNKGEDEAVRIFVEFKTLPSAIKALTDLNGRFFGGRVVKATFYNLDKFKRKELSDEI